MDRDAALKEAEQLLREGKLDGAIEAYVRLVEDRPSDWDSISALGDLCLRAGDVERAATRFTRIADYFFVDGALDEAVLLYKKALDANGGHEPALRRLAEIAVQQGLHEDAERYQWRLTDQCRRGGDEQEMPLEVELSDVLDDLAAAPAETVGLPPADPGPPALEPAQGGNVAEDVAALELAARDPRPAFAAAAELGRLYVRQGELRAGVEWLERATGAPPANQEDRFAVLYDLADAFDGLGQPARAVAVMIDLDLDSGGYRGGRARIDRVMLAHAGSPGQ